jgi:hypothetical protein
MTVGEGTSLLAKEMGAPQEGEQKKMAETTELPSSADAEVEDTTDPGQIDGSKEKEDTFVEDAEETSQAKPSLWQRAVAFYTANSFLILVVIAILLAFAYPPLGADYLQPQITATWIAVMFIFGMYMKQSSFIPPKSTEYLKGILFSIV